MGKCQLCTSWPRHAVARYLVLSYIYIYIYHCVPLTKALQVLTEVRDAPRTLKIAAPIAIATVTLLYVLANIAFFAAMSKQEIADSKVIVAAAFFENVSRS